MSQVVSLQATLKSLHGVAGGIPTGPPTITTSRVEGATRSIKEFIHESGISEPLRGKYIYYM